MIATLRPPSRCCCGYRRADDTRPSGPPDWDGDQERCGQPPPAARAYRAAHEDQRHLTVDERYRGPDDCCEPAVVADERREGYFPFSDVHHHVARQEPRGGLDPHPVLVAVHDLPSEQAVRCGPQLQAKTEEHTLDQWHDTEHAARYGIQRRLDQLLRIYRRLANRRGDDVGVVGIWERAQRANRLWNIALPVDARRVCAPIATRGGRVGVLG